jgi:hypothetical protein
MVNSIIEQVEFVDYQTTKSHSVLIHPKHFKQQPKDSLMGKVTKDLKRIGFSKRHSMQEIFECFSQGQNIVLANVELDTEVDKLRFLSASMFAIDVDDTEMVTDPVDVLRQLKGQAVGLFYTFSHGIKGNRYRLVFQLSRSVTDERHLKGIIEVKAKELRAKGVPVDLQAKIPTLPVRGGRQGYLINDYDAVLDVDSLLEKVEKQNLKRQKELYKQFEKPLKPVPFETLKEMAEKVGYLPSGVSFDVTEDWKRITMGIKHYVVTGNITEDEGWELYDIISGGEQSRRAYDGLKPNGQATIGSLIAKAQDKGYKSKFVYFPEVQVNFERETIKVKQYIPTEVAEDILASKQRILVDSPTGSGKTSAFISAMKKRENALLDEFYIFAMPTIALTMQTANKHQVLAIKGQTKDLFKQINQQIWNGKRVFISTYDMTPKLVDFITIILQKYNRQPKFFLVVDELHKFVTDYDDRYRLRAIRDLYKVSQKAKTFVGLSGTTEDIYKQEFDKVIKIENGNPQSPCLEIAVYSYEHRDTCLPELAKVIEARVAKNRLLVYIQSKKKIEQLKNVLRRKGIKVRTISADSKSNPTYKQLIEHESVDTDVQVILTTSVIADGVNIKNVKRDNGVPILHQDGTEMVDLEWEVIAVCNEFSNLFNPSSLKQISNRLRNHYRRFSLFMQVPKKDDTQRFQLEGAYGFRKRTAERIVKELNEHPYFDRELFRNSVIEKRYGIFQTSDGSLDIDTLKLRHWVSDEQERYYMHRRKAFVEAIKKTFHYQPEIRELNISKEILDNNLNTALEQGIIQEIEEAEQEREREKSKSISQAFTLDVYKAFQQEDDRTLAAFKKTVHDRQYACLKSITKIADYKTSMKVVKQVQRNADTYVVRNDIRSLVDVTYQQSILRPLKTKKVLDKLLALDEFIENKEMEAELERIAKEERVATSDVKKVLPFVQFEHTRKEKVRLKRVIGLITVQSVAAKHGLTESEVVALVKEWASKFEKPVVRKVMESKLFSKW